MRKITEYETFKNDVKVIGNYKGLEILKLSKNFLSYVFNHHECVKYVDFDDIIDGRQLEYIKFYDSEFYVFID